MANRRVSTLNRWEPITTKSWTAAKQTRFTKDADLDQSRWLRSILINIQGTATVAGGPATGLLGDNVGAILDSFVIKGKNRTRSSTDAFVEIAGADLYELKAEYAGVVIEDNSAALATANGAYALDFNLIYDFPPPDMHASEQVGYLLDVPNWSNLEIDLNFGDEKSLWNLGVATVTWSAQTVNLLGKYAMEPGKFEGFAMGLRYLQQFQNFTSQLSTTAKAVALQQLDNKGKIASLLLKTGVVAQTTTAGKTAFSSLSNAILANLGVFNFPKQLFKQFYRYTDVRAANADNYKRSPSKGYALVEFRSDKLPFGALDPSALPTGKAKSSNIQLVSDVTGAANQGLVVVQESLYYDDQIVIPEQ